MSIDKVKQKLLELVGDDSVEIPVIVESYGAAVMTFKNAKTAESKARILRLSTIGQCQLHAKFLPEIMTDQIPADICPLLVFVNAKSGGGQGKVLWSKISAILNPHQVYALDPPLGPLFGLLAFRNVQNFRVLVAGGDGTVGWVLNQFDDLRSVMTCTAAPVVILPVGTGNDLSRVLKWGPGYTGEKLRPLLEDIIYAEEKLLDRWYVNATDRNGETHDMAMTNYFGIGIDAQIALDFHKSREENPEKFSSRTHNKSVYVMKGMDALMKRPCRDVIESIVLIADGVPLKLPSDLEGIIVLNISSFGAGADPWGDDKDQNYKPQSYSDGYVEVIGLFGAWHLSNISTRLRTGKRLKQCQELEFHLTADIPVQVDGEPWRQEHGVIKIARTKHQVMMLERVKRKKRDRLRSTSSMAGRQAATDLSGTH